MKIFGYSPVDFKGFSYPVLLTENASNNILTNIFKLERKYIQISGWNDTKRLINIYGMASAMSYLHSKDIVHRNLIPDTIFLDEYLLPKIGYFDLLSRYNVDNKKNLASVANSKDSYIYCAPEVLKSNNFSKASDIYAFAFIVYELMFKENSFKDFNLNELYTNVVIKGNRPVIKKIYPKCYSDLIESCWSQDPNERISFDRIVKLLKTDSDFITEKINKNDYLEYINYIDEYQKILECTKKSIEFADYKKSRDTTKEKEEHNNIIESTTSNQSTQQMNENTEGNLIIKINKEEKKNSLTNEHSSLIQHYIETKQPKLLIEFLHNKCDNNTISYIFDKCYAESKEFYLDLCQEGILINNSVSHHKYAVYLIFNQKEKSEMDNIFDKARFHLETAIKLGFHFSYFYLARLLHEHYHDDENALKIAQEGLYKEDKYSKCLFGYFIAHGIGIKKDHEKGFSIILESNANDLIELFFTDIGIYYSNPNSNHFSEKESFNCFEKAYNIKKTKATISNYGLCFFIGFGIEKNIQKAKRIFYDNNINHQLEFIQEEESNIFDQISKNFKKSAQKGNIKSLEIITKKY